MCSINFLIHDFVGSEKDRFWETMGKKVKHIKRQLCELPIFFGDRYGKSDPSIRRLCLAKINKHFGAMCCNLDNIVCNAYPLEVNSITSSFNVGTEIPIIHIFYVVNDWISIRSDCVPNMSRNKKLKCITSTEKWLLLEICNDIVALVNELLPILKRWVNVSLPWTQRPINDYVRIAMKEMKTCLMAIPTTILRINQLTLYADFETFVYFCKISFLAELPFNVLRLVGMYFVK